jgi:hypothetical protein
LSHDEVFLTPNAALTALIGKCHSTLTKGDHA